MTPRAIVLILDGLGVGDLPDAAEFGDSGRNTLANLAAAVGGVSLPALEGLGLGRVQPFAGMDAERAVRGAYGRMAEKSRGKDSTTGHWELAGLVIDTAFPVFPAGFPAAVLDELTRRSGYGFLGNEAASGTEIIERLGDAHCASGKPILYTSADSVLQVAAHEDVLPLEELYAFCRLAREVMQGEFGVSRVIARPFVGASGNFRRSLGRRDFSLPPPGETLLDRMLAADLPVTGIGKVMDLFAGRGFTRRVESKSNAQGMAKLTELQAEPAAPGLLLINLVDFDMLWGHRRDPEGYAGGLREFDAFLAGFLARLKPEDRLFITADHGNDPTGPGSDHTREYVPLLAYRPGMDGPVDLGRRPGFGDLAETLAEAFGLAPFGVGRSFWTELEGGAMKPAATEDADLIRAALDARSGAHAPYSGFRVGAALRTDDGTLLSAANLENASLGLSVCAERNLVARAVFDGRRDWRRLAIATDADAFTPPCGACLQVLREFASDLEILLVNAAGDCRVHRLADFLPRPFTDYPRGDGGA